MRQQVGRPQRDGQGTAHQFGSVLGQHADDFLSGLTLAFGQFATLHRPADLVRGDRTIIGVFAAHQPLDIQIGEGSALGEDVAGSHGDESLKRLENTVSRRNPNETFINRVAVAFTL